MAFDECGDVVLVMVAKWKFLLLDSVNCIKCASTQEDLKKIQRVGIRHLAQTFIKTLSKAIDKKKLIADNVQWVKL